MTNSGVLTADCTTTFERSLRLSDHKHKCVDIALVLSNPFKKHPQYCKTFYLLKMGNAFLCSCATMSLCVCVCGDIECSGLFVLAGYGSNSGLQNRGRCALCVCGATQREEFYIMRVRSEFRLRGSHTLRS